jgi:putative aminopeptidase FrvX
VGIFGFEFFMRFFLKRQRKQSESLELKIQQEKLTEQELKRIITSQNIVAEIGPQNAKHQFFFTAHFDSVSSKLPMRYIKIAGIFSFGSFFLFSLAYNLNFLFILVFDSYFMNSWTALYFGLVLICLFSLETLILMRTFRGNESHGIIDDGSGVAILLELAKFLKNQEITNHKFTFGFFGAEEAGLIGSSYYHRNSSIPQNTHIISVDMIGEKTPLTYIKGIHPIIKKKLNPSFNDQLVSIANQLDIELKGSNFLYPGSDFAHWLYDGYKTNWLINGSKYIHSKHDRLKNVDEGLVNDALRLLLAYIYLELSTDSIMNG